MKSDLLLRTAAAALVLCAAGCASTIVPLRDTVPLAAQVPASARLVVEPGPAPSATQAAATAPEVPPELARNPNETTRLVYRANYEDIFDQAEQVLTDMGFRIDRKDYRLGTISTLPEIAPQIAEPWRPDQVGWTNALENTINQDRWSVTITVRRVAGHPEFLAIGAQVLVERQTNPNEMIGGEAFVEGSGFGRNPLALRSDFSQPGTNQAPQWYLVGHQPGLENKVLNALFKRI